MTEKTDQYLRKHNAPMNGRFSVYSNASTKDLTAGSNEDSFPWCDAGTTLAELNFCELSIWRAGWAYFNGGRAHLTVHRDLTVLSVGDKIVGVLLLSNRIVGSGTDTADLWLIGEA